MHGEAQIVQHAAQMPPTAVVAQVLLLTPGKGPHAIRRVWRYATTVRPGAYQLAEEATVAMSTKVDLTAQTGTVLNKDEQRTTTNTILLKESNPVVLDDKEVIVHFEHQLSNLNLFGA